MRLCFKYNIFIPPVFYLFYFTYFLYWLMSKGSRVI